MKWDSPILTYVGQGRYTVNAEISWPRPIARLTRERLIQCIAMLWLDLSSILPISKVSQVALKEFFLSLLVTNAESSLAACSFHLGAITLESIVQTSDQVSDQSQ